MKALRTALGAIRAGFGGREVVFLIGLLLVALGGERFHPGVGMVIAGTWLLVVCVMGLR